MSVCSLLRVYSPWLGRFAVTVAVVATGCGDDTTTSAANFCEPIAGTVARILDGDTVELQGGEQVRYLLVDTPETGERVEDHECFAEEARELNRSLVQGREIALEYDGRQCTETFGRLLAYVSVDGRMVNRVLLERGYGFVPEGIDKPDNHPEDYEREAEFRQIQAQAMEASKGLWGVCR